MRSKKNKAPKIPTIKATSPNWNDEFTTGIPGDSTKALRENSPELAAEQSKEAIVSLMNNIMQNKEVDPFIIAINNGKPLIIKCKRAADGTIIIPELKLITDEDLENKSKAVRRIIDRITPVLQADIENVTYMALMRKDSDTLTEVMQQLTNPDPNKPKPQPRLQNRLGCIWLIIGDHEFII